MNAFDHADGIFRALRNHEGQWSLWPAALAVPEGWQAMCEPLDRASCLRLIETEWSDMRPAGLIGRAEGPGGA